MEVDRGGEDPRFARLPDNATVGVQQAGEFLGQRDDPSKPLSAIRVKQLARAGRLRATRLSDASNAPYMFRMGTLRRFKGAWGREPIRPTRSEQYDFDSLPDDTEVYSARAAARFLHMHHQKVGQAALSGLADPGNARLLHGRKLSPNRGGAWVFSMRELRRYRRVREQARTGRGEDVTNQEVRERSARASARRAGHHQPPAHEGDVRTEAGGTPER